MKLSIKHFSSSCKAIIAITAMFMAVVCVWAIIEQWHASHLDNNNFSVTNSGISKNK